MLHWLFTFLTFGVLLLELIPVPIELYKYYPPEYGVMILLALYIVCGGRREPRQTTGRQTVTRVDNGLPYRRLNQRDFEIEEQPETPHEFPV
ncbi:hypothetical protein AC249_AIPGENE3004 [Exaiptasia diaphana]|nr:hypothetical protein AC249_AIPGENE3004 [Exaiptasia diaphana]